jgi:hypothetical protein
MGFGAGAVLDALGFVAAAAGTAGATSACAADATGTGATLGVSLGAVAHPVVNAAATKTNGAKERQTVNPPVNSHPHGERGRTAFSTYDGTCSMRSI